MSRFRTSQPPRSDTTRSLAGTESEAIWRAVWSSLLGAIAAAAWITLWLHLATESEIKDLLGIVLPPVVALVGSALGFYFGGKPAAK
jgi:hypothetical protein